MVDIVEALREDASSPILIFVNGRRDADDLAVKLDDKVFSELGLSATTSAYHGGLSTNAKDTVREWITAVANGDTTTATLRVVVATLAFGMGIDIPGLNHIVIWNLPASVSDMYQMALRGGRDGKPCLVLIFGCWADRLKHKARALELLEKQPGDIVAARVATAAIADADELYALVNDTARCCFVALDAVFEVRSDGEGERRYRCGKCNVCTSAPRAAVDSFLENNIDNHIAAEMAHASRAGFSFQAICVASAKKCTSRLVPSSTHTHTHTWLKGPAKHVIKKSSLPPLA